MKVKNTKTGKEGILIKETDSHYIVKLENGRRSRWVKHNTMIYGAPQTPKTLSEAEINRIKAAFKDSIDQPSMAEKILENLERSNLHLQNIALDIEKISQTIPFPEDLPFGIDDVIEGIIAGEGVTLLCGKPKTGKTTIALQIAESAATGKPFLGNCPKPRECLFVSNNTDEFWEYLDFEPSKKPTRLDVERAENLYDDYLDMFDFIVVDGLDRLDLDYWIRLSKSFQKRALHTPILITDTKLPVKWGKSTGIHTIAELGGKFLSLTGKRNALLPIRYDFGRFESRSLRPGVVYRDNGKSYPTPDRLEVL